MAGLMTPPKKPLPGKDADASPPNDDSMPLANGQADDMDAGAESEGDSEGVTPEEQEQLNQFVINGFSLIYADPKLGTIRESLKGDGDPIQGLASTASTIVMRLMESARESNVEMDPDIVYHGGIQLLEDLADLSARLGIHEFNEKELDAALLRGLDIVQMSGAGDQQVAQQDMRALAEADRQGLIDQHIPGLAQAFGGKGAAPQENADG